MAMGMNVIAQSRPCERAARVLLGGVGGNDMFIIIFIVISMSVIIIWPCRVLVLLALELRVQGLDALRRTARSKRLVCYPGCRS